jgi:hypothetical protein
MAKEWPESGRVAWKCPRVAEEWRKSSHGGLEVVRDRPESGESAAGSGLRQAIESFEAI